MTSICCFPKFALFLLFYRLISIKFNERVFIRIRFLFFRHFALFCGILDILDILDLIFLDVIFIRPFVTF
jgi:hypothetical protein